MAPLAGKPPFATDEPDSFYESSPAPRRVRQQPPPDPNKRSSAYDVYDNYLADGKPADDRAASRQSGIGALGMGLMNMEDSDDDDDDDEHGSYARRNPQQLIPSPATPTTPTSKHAALAAATAPTPLRNNSPPPQPPQPIAAPRPGYVAPIAALNLARPEPVAEPQGRQPQRVQPPALRIDSPRSLQNPFDNPPSPHSPYHHIPSSPSPSMLSSEPHPLLPPVTPITPVFARPAKPAGVKFAESTRDPKPIMRGNSEETLLPTRGEKGDDFWRRFSMIAKEENKKPYAQKQSVWLKKTQSGATRLSRWVWIVGLVLLICIGAAIGIGWYFSHNSPAHQAPKAFGGSENETAATAPISTTASSVVGTSTSVRVTPTRTVARRDSLPRRTPVAGFSAGHKRRMH